MPFIPPSSLFSLFLFALLFAMTTSTTQAAAFYRIGTPGTPWSNSERAEWLAQTKILRSYREEVLDKIDKLKDTMDVVQYGALSHNQDRYPLMAVKSRDWQPEKKPCVLLTGGVHGYEKSGIFGAIRFLETKALLYAKHFNIIVAPCVSPWAYEHIQRWQADVEDPNRSFKKGEESLQTEESRALMQYLQTLGVSKRWICHIDLHETTNSDDTEFRPARAAKAGLDYTPSGIPDGFYLVTDSLNPQLEWQSAIIDSVRKVTHIAPPDGQGKIIGEPVVAEGIISIATKEYGLCGGVTGGDYTTTTEVFPDSPRATDEICNQAQVAAITGALDYIILQK
jgi:hypothetical protein